MKLTLLLILLAPALSWGAYAPQEMCIIPWGDSANQLKISMPFYEDVNITPRDSSDDWIEFTGPKMAVVDHAENVYVASYFYMQLKAFDSNGRLIFDCSKGTSQYNTEVFRSNIGNIFINSLSQIFVIDGKRYDYITVIDENCNIIDKISPNGTGSRIMVRGFSPAFDDKLIISCNDGTYYTYSAGSITPSGGPGWLAKDNYYYMVELENSNKIAFTKYHDPDRYGVGQNMQVTYKSLTDSGLYYLEFPGVDNQMNLYVYLVGPTPSDGKIQIYNSSFNLVDEIILPQKPNKYMWYMTPYMRPSDGNIYEFRVLDDGLHVIRWRKE